MQKLIPFLSTNGRLATIPIWVKDELIYFPGRKSDVVEENKLIPNQDTDEQLPRVDQLEKGSFAQMKRLGRRLERMAKDLKLSEEEVKRLRGLLAEACDSSVASVYKSVQGLSDNEPNSELKRDLLNRVFESNLEIWKRLAQ